MNINGITALITGGGGLIGSTIADILIEKGAKRVIALDNFIRGDRRNIEAALATGKLDLVVGDIRDRELLGRLLGQVDTVFHMAALRINHCVQEPREALEVMFDGSFNVVHGAVQAGIKQIVVASSSSIYGQADSFPTGESHHPYNDTTLYGAGKIALEGMLRSFREMSGLEYAALRYFNVYGPRMDIFGAYTEVMVRWMEKLEAGEAPLIFGDGKQSMDFTFVGDAAMASVLALENCKGGEAFNVGTGVTTSLGRLCELMCKAMGKDVSPIYQPPRVGGGPVSYRLADISKAKAMLGFEPMVDLEEGLGRLVSWWRQERVRKTTS